MSPSSVGVAEVVPARHDTGGRKASIVTGICTRHDAVSDSVLVERQLLADAGWDVRVFTHYTDVLEAPDVVVTDHPWAVHQESHFARSELVIFHFATAFSLFDAIVVPHPTARYAVRFHNVTPPELLRGTARRSAIEALEQVGGTLFADAVWCDSEFNRRTLDWLHLDPDRVTVQPLCVPGLDDDRLCRIVPRPHEGPVRIAYIGRFVGAKGVGGLVEALAQMGDVPDWTADLYGSSTNSDRLHLDELHQLVAARGLGDRVRFCLDVDDAELWRRLEASDLLVVPSHHEGFCLPVIEALAAGCRVVSTDAGALPDTVDGCGRLVPVADVGAMSTAIAETLREVCADRSSNGLDDADRRAKVRAHLESFTVDRFRERFLAAVDELMARPPRGGLRDAS